MSHLLRVSSAAVAIGMACAAVGTLCVDPTAQAAPNGLTHIPISNVFGDGVADFSVERDVQQSQAMVYTTQYGIGNHFEIGLDYQASPPDEKVVLGNVKYLLARPPGRLPDVACGFTNIGTG